MAIRERSIRVLIGTVGGQGGGVLSSWFTKGLLNAGWNAQSIGLLGLSQRAGSVIYYMEAMPEGGPLPVFSAYAVPGDVDVILSQEFLELGRLLQGGFAGPECVVVANTYRYFGTLEKMPGEGGVYPSGLIRQAAERLAKDSFLFHAQDQVTEAGLSHLSSNAMLLGACVASSAFELPAEPFHQAIREAEVGVEDNLRAFDLGYQRMRSGELPRAQFREQPAEDWQALASRRAPELPERLQSGYRDLLEQARGELPSLGKIFAEALYRLVDFQNLRYAEEYLQQVRAMAAAEQQTNPSAEVQQYPVTAPFARHLASWMTYEDGPRVAQLKTRSSRFAEIRAEHRIADGQPFVVEDYLAPDPPQIYGMLPRPLGALVRALGCRLRDDFDQISLPMRIRTNSVRGALTLGLVARLRHLRRSSYRHAEEVQLIERWRRGVERWMQVDPRLGALAAEAGRLVKGYGRVRDQALDDLWLFLDQGLPLLEAGGADDADLLDDGRSALKTIAAEAGKGPAGLALLQARRERSQAA